MTGTLPAPLSDDGDPAGPGRLRQQNGVLHGGVLSYAADNTLTFAAGTVASGALMPPDSLSTTCGPPTA